MKLKIYFLAFVLIGFGCKKNETVSSVDIQETAQQVGDVMASVDESGGGSGSIAYLNQSIQKTFDRHAPNEINESMIAKIILPKAQAASCAGAGFAACNGSFQVIRTFGGCTVGSAVFSGDVTFQWSGAACALSNGQNVTRSPNFTVTGRRGATLAVTKTGTFGQRINRISAGNFTFENDGINRRFTLPNSQVLFNQTTTVTSAITVTGASRASRVMSGGSLRVTNNISNVTCDYVPTAVTWNTTSCNCPVSGSWSGTCSDGKNTSISITGCGTATYTEGSDTESVTFDRCGT